MLSSNIFLVCLFIGVLGDSNNFLTPCPKEDINCQLKSANNAFPKLLNALPDLGIESSDPLHIDEIIGDLSILKYKFTDSSFSGLKKCSIHNFKLDWASSNMNFNMTCTNLALKGQYEISGRLIILPVEGNGDYIIHMKKYEFNFDIDFKQSQGKDGTTYLAIKKYTTKADAQENMKFDFKNLFNGNQELANTVLTFANQSWKEVAEFVQAPVVTAVVKKVVTNINKYLKTVPIEKLTL